MLQPVFSKVLGQIQQLTDLVVTCRVPPSGPRVRKPPMSIERHMRRCHLLELI